MRPTWSYQSAVAARARHDRNVFVTRTFSKAVRAQRLVECGSADAIGRAGTMQPLEKPKTPYNISVLGSAAAIAALGRTRSTSTRNASATQRDAPSRSKSMGETGRKTADSQGNLLFVDVGKPCEGFPRTRVRPMVPSASADFRPLREHARAHLDRRDDRCGSKGRSSATCSRPVGGQRQGQQPAERQGTWREKPDAHATQNSFNRVGNPCSSCLDSAHAPRRRTLDDTEARQTAQAPSGRSHRSNNCSSNEDPGRAPARPSWKIP